jgi:hypothetical protein
MVASSFNENVEFIQFLKNFQTEVLRMPWKDVTPVANPIKARLEHIFSVYINIHLMNETDANNLTRMFDRHGIHKTVRSLIMCVWVCKLDDLNTGKGGMVRDRIFTNHIFNVGL